MGASLRFFTISQVSWALDMNFMLARSENSSYVQNSTPAWVEPCI